MNYQDSDSRFTPNNGALPEDPIGDVILGKDINNFNVNRYQQQIQEQYTPNYQQSLLRNGSVDDINNTGSNNIYNSNNTVTPATNSNVVEVVKVVKLRFEIDFQINLNVVSK